MARSKTHGARMFWGTVVVLAVASVAVWANDDDEEDDDDHHGSSGSSSSSSSSKGSGDSCEWTAPGTGRTYDLSDMVRCPLPSSAPSCHPAPIPRWVWWMRAVMRKGDDSVGRGRMG